MAQPRRKVTYDDLLEVLEHKVAEIIEGELVVAPRPASPQALAGTAIASTLFDTAEPFEASPIELARWRGEA